MLKIENVVLPSPKQMEAVIRGMRNPKNSWDKSDSYKTFIENSETENTADFAFFLGKADWELMRTLASGGPVHGKFKRMIPVYLDITASLYWWKEFDTYKVGTVANSCSTMHKIHAKEFTLEDFSCEYLTAKSMECLQSIIELLNKQREAYINYKPNDGFYIDADYQLVDRKVIWWQLIQLLPTSYNQKRTVMLNYEVLTSIYEYRKDHKLDEWHTLCDWIKQLPYSELITGDYAEEYPY